MTIQTAETEKVRAIHFNPDGSLADLSPATNYFEVFALPPTLNPDVDALREHFLELSRQVHPDFHATDTEAVRQKFLTRSALVNNAWKTLRDPIRRAEYVIETFGKGIQSDKGAVPPELLEEMFDIQEAGEELREARLSADAQALKAAEARVAPLRKSAMAAREQLLGELSAQSREFDGVLDQHDGDPGHDDCQALMKKIRLTLDRMNYLRTVLRNLK